MSPVAYPDGSASLKAELAVISSVQAALAAKLDIQGIYHAVGDKVREIFHDADVGIRIYDPKTNMVHLPYYRERGEQRAVMPYQLQQGFAAHVMRTRETLVINENMAQAYEKFGSYLLPGTQMEKSGVYVPLVTGNQARGLIQVQHMEREHAFSDSDVRLLQTLADSMSVALENARLLDETQRLLKETEQRNAELAVISSVQAALAAKLDIQGIYDTVGSKVREIFQNRDVEIRLYDPRTGLVHFPYHYEKGMRITIPSSPLPARGFFPHIIRTRETLVVNEGIAQAYEKLGASVLPGTDQEKSSVYVPLITRGEVRGLIGLMDMEHEHAFSDSDVRLLQTLANSMSVALENARLFDEAQRRTREAAALVEVGRDISSTLDVAAVMDRIANHAKELLAADNSAIFLPDADGRTYRAIVAIGDVAEQIKATEIHDGVGIIGSVLRAGHAELINDTEADSRTIQIPGTPRRSDERLMVAPLLAGESVKGGMAVWRRGGRVFDDAEREFLVGLSLQAAVAIENARLFNETQEAVDHLKASAEVLGVISSSVADTKPVLDKILESCERLFQGHHIGMTLLENDVVCLGGYYGPVNEMFVKMYPFRLDPDSGTGKAIMERRLIHFENVQTDAGVPERMRAAGVLTNTKSQVLVPMTWKGRAIGAIFVGRPVVRPFSEKEIALVKTFADQAVIAIENARLFSELERRTAQLARSVSELKALGEVGQAVSSTLDLDVVLSTIVSRATELAGVDGGSIYEYDEVREQFHLRAADRLPEDLIEALRANPIRKGEGLLGRMAVLAEPVEISDIAVAGAYQSHVREMLIQMGYRSLLVVPLLREDHLLGGLAVNRKSAGAFEPGAIELLKTFATQSAMAIENARLFSELQKKGHELETASRHKSEFLANMSHELRTPLNAIIGFSEVLAERMFGDINDKQAEYVGDIRESGRHLLTLINDILDLSKIEAGRMELEPNNFDLPSAIENTLTLVRERAQRRGIALARTVDERLGTIRADERKVKQVLLNLLSNALKFTPEGGRIDVRADLRDGEAVIAVTDTGVGIAPEDQAAVFEEFRQVGAAATKAEGTGLGLAIARKFIELHGGKIWVTSQLRAGCTFSFTLPLSKPRDHQPDR